MRLDRLTLLVALGVLASATAGIVRAGCTDDICFQFDCIAAKYEGLSRRYFRPDMPQSWYGIIKEPNYYTTGGGGSYVYEDWTAQQPVEPGTKECGAYDNSKATGCGDDELVAFGRYDIGYCGSKGSG